MRLLAISDLHLGNPANRTALQALPPHPDDWLIVAGDVAERDELLHDAFSLLVRRFALVIWAPGNHELWTATHDPKAARGDARYRQLVDLCRVRGVITPEDEFPIWPGHGRIVIAPVFAFYDYSFRPPEVSEQDAVAWALESGVLCADEHFLDPAPFPSRQAWCASRCRESERRLAQIPAGYEIVLVNHYPLRQDLAQLYRIPRFSLWCGTRATEAWITRFPIRIAVSGHLHCRATDYRGRVRFEEVSLGYPHQWDQRRGVDTYLREILSC